jgi:hypothetical protein
VSEQLTVLRLILVELRHINAHLDANLPPLGRQPIPPVARRKKPTPIITRAMAEWLMAQPPRPREERPPPAAPTPVHDPKPIDLSTCYWPGCPGEVVTGAVLDGGLVRLFCSAGHTTDRRADEMTKETA